MTRQFLDLVGLPWSPDGSDPKKGVSCLWVVREALERLRGPIADGALPRGALSSEEAARWAERGGGEHWEMVGEHWRCASRLGDVLLTETGDGPHVAVVVEEREGLVLTATRSRGVIIRKARLTAGPLRVYRLR